jgi:hypothetical protein
MNTEIATHQKVAGFDLSPQTFEQALTFSQYLADSDMVPKDFKGKPGNCLVAIQWGMEIGMKPMQAMQNIAVINGRPSLWGDALIALARSSSLCEYIIETQTDSGATCKVKRRGEPEQERTFTLVDAKLAGLVGKAGPWAQHPKRMMQMRARAFAIRDVFPDVLKGLACAEEVMDSPPRHMGAAEVVTPAAPESYPDEKFRENLPAWHKVILDGRKTVDHIITMANSKYPLTDAQKKAIRAVPVENNPDGPVDSSAMGITAAQIKAQLQAANDLDSLYTVADLIDGLTNHDQRGELDAIFQTRQLELEQK